jgi:hypothetical protein
MRGVWSTLVLVLVLAGLLGYIYFIDARREPGDDREQAFASVTAEDIEEVRIRSAEGETSRLTKTDGTWRLAEPVQAEADENEISSITSSLASLDIQRVVDENASDLKQYGLDPARIEVAFRTRGSTDERRILLGEKTPTGGDLYARLPDGQRVFLVSSFLDSTFNKDTFALRDKSVLKIDRDKVDAVEIVAAGRTIRLAKNGTDWRIAQPIGVRADFAAVEGSLERLSSARMQGIVAPEGGDLKKYRLDPPIATFTAVSGSSRASLLLGETENAVIYAKDASRPMVFTVAPTLYTDLIRDVSEYRRKDLFDARSFTVTRAEFQRDGGKLVLEKSKSADGKEVWRNAEGKDVDSTKAEDLLSKITALRADSFESAANPALKSPALTVNIQFDDKKTEQVTLARAGGDVVASRSDEPGSAKLTAAGFDDVLKALDEINK